ncbi:hypothetical protein QZH41_009298 [Actinostola sp. cb2023]|nr:hypothetical protein QZH41_009298 [Actinostola sp. cb2023]
MAKGRRSVPSKEKEGFWFPNRGWPREFNPVKYKPNRVPTPPKQFEEKAESPYKHFMFSKHDDRHDLQDHGVYFGNGLGKRTLPERSQHYSNNMITWNMQNDHHSNYMVSYRGSTAYPAKFRRYPKDHQEGKPGTAPLSTTTTKWCNHRDATHRTPLHVMATTQEPLLPPNSWVYSYRPKGHVWS